MPDQDPHPSIRDRTPTLTKAEEHALREQANRVHQAIFGGDAPGELQRQYALAIASAPLAEAGGVDVERALRSGADLEALELVLRRRQPRNPLTQRFQTMCYLAEARPEYYARFVNDERRFAAAAAALLFHAVRSAWLYCKGRVLLVLHARR
jgi:hypothetical protein